MFGSRLSERKGAGEWPTSGKRSPRSAPAFNAHDLDRIMTFFADDCVARDAAGTRPLGHALRRPAGVRQGLASRFDGLPDVHYGDDEHFATPSARPASRNGP